MMVMSVRQVNRPTPDCGREFWKIPRNAPTHLDIAFHRSCPLAIEALKASYCRHHTGTEDLQFNRFILEESKYRHSSRRRCHTLNLLLRAPLWNIVVGSSISNLVTEISSCSTIRLQEISAHRKSTWRRILV